jgi:rRNA-processing protein FCF1
MPAIFKNTLLEAKRTIKLPCEHGGGVIDVDKCIESFIGKRNENKVFVGTNDEALRNRIRDKGIAPIFFYDTRSGILIMDKPSDVVNQKL